MAFPFAGRSLDSRLLTITGGLVAGAAGLTTAALSRLLYGDPMQGNLSSIPAILSIAAAAAAIAIAVAVLQKARQAEAAADLGTTWAKVIGHVAFKAGFSRRPPPATLAAGFDSIGSARSAAVARDDLGQLANLALLGAALGLMTSWSLVAIAAGAMAISAWAGARQAKKQGISSITTTKLNAERRGLLHEGLHGLRDLLCLRGEDQYISRLGEISGQIEQHSAKTAKDGALTMAILRYLPGFLSTLIVGVGCWEMTQHSFGPGDLIGAMLLTGQLVGGGSMISGLMSMIYGGKPAESLLTDLENVPLAKDGVLELQNPRGRLDIEHLQFGYPGSANPILRDINLTIEAGDTVALAGRSGDGKSTLFDALVRLIDPQQGRILLDGEPINNFTLASYRAAVGLLPQEPKLFSGTVRDNLLLAKPAATDEELLAVLQSVGLGNDVAILSRVLNGVGPSGLSGGQQKRFALARLILQDAKVWLIDEITAGLDAQTVEEILKLVSALSIGRTVIHATHDQRVVAICSRIVHLANGLIYLPSPVPAPINAISQSKTADASNSQSQAADASNSQSQAADACISQSQAADASNSQEVRHAAE